MARHFNNESILQTFNNLCIKIKQNRTGLTRKLLNEPLLTIIIVSGIT